MMIPEAWENHESMAPSKKAFYQYHASLMEPWDGPASIAFTDGTVIGAVLDRNGLRPSRYWVTDDDLVIMASEVGVLDVDRPRRSCRRAASSRAACSWSTPPRAASSTTTRSRPSSPRAHPYGEWLDDNLVDLDELPAASTTTRAAPLASSQRQQVFGYTTEELKILVEPMARTGVEPLGSMGTDTPIAVLSRPLPPAVRLLQPAVRPGHQPAARRHPRGAGHRPRQHASGPRATCSTRGPTSCRQIYLPRPVLDNDELAKLVHINDYDDLADFQHRRHPVPLPGGRGRRGPAPGARRASGARPPRPSTTAPTSSSSPTAAPTAELAPIPSLLFTARGAPPPHPREDPHPGRPGRRDRRGPRGAPHVPPARATAPPPSTPTSPSRPSRTSSPRTSPTCSDPVKAVDNYIKACGKGVLKVMSKMGISTVASYTGAQIFEAIGLAHELVDEYFTGTVSRLGGVGLDELAEEVRLRHAVAYPDRPDRAGPPHARGRRRVPVAPRGRVPPLQPRDRLQAPARHPHRPLRRSSRSTPQLVDDQAAQLATLRGLFALPRPASARRSRSTRSSRSARSSSASPPAPCPTARSRPRPTRPSPSP